VADDPADSETSAALVIRVWAPAKGRFTARLIRVDDLPHGEAVSQVADTEDDLLALVRSWVDEVTGRPQGS
jgi:hypothetical protein